MIVVLLVCVPVIIILAAVLAWAIIELVNQRKLTMATSAAAQAVVDELNAAAGALTTALANADANATAQSAEDIAAIKAAVDPLVAAINAAAAPVA